MPHQVGYAHPQHQRSRSQMQRQPHHMRG
jgi:hypothetical protein